MRARAARSRAGASLAALALLATGCGLIPHSKLYDPPKAQSAVKYGGVLNVGIGRPQAIEPTNAYEPYGRMISSLICQPLLSVDPLDGTVKPALAKSFSITDNGETIFITLNHGLKFANGDKLTAGSIYDALNRLASPDYQSYVAGLLSEVSGYDRYHGQGANSGGGLTGGKSDSLSQVQIIDNWSVRIHLTPRDPSFVRVLADPATAPIDGPAEKRDPTGFSKDPVCLGPYRLVKAWDPKDSLIRLVHNPAYKPDDPAYTNNGKPYPTEIDFHVYDTAAQQLAAYDAGQIDVVTDPGEDVAALTKKYGQQLQTGPGTMLDLVSFPTGTEPFNQPAVRVALSQAIDRDKIASVTYAGRRLPLTGLLPPVVGKDAYKNSSCSNAPAGGDVAAARATLAGAGVDLTSKKINFYYNDEYGHKALVAEIAREWHAAFGVDVVPKPMQWDTYIGKAETGASFDGPFLESWDQLPHRQIDYVLPLISRSGLGTANLSRYDSAQEVNIAGEQLKQISSQGDEILVLHKLGKLGCTDMPVAPLALHRAELLVRTSAVGSARSGYLALDGSPILREMFVRGPGGGS